MKRFFAVLACLPVFACTPAPERGNKEGGTSGGTEIIQEQPADKTQVIQQPGDTLTEDGTTTGSDTLR